MKGGIEDFLRLVAETPDLAEEVVALARRFDFEFTDELSDADLDAVAGGATVKVSMSSLTGGGLPDGMTGPPAGGGSVPTPYPNVGGEGGDGSVKVVPDGTNVQTGGHLTSSSGNQGG